MAKSTKSARQPAKKRNTKAAGAGLNTCPIGNAGWCAYPFSVDQLQKRLKRAAEGSKAEKELAVSGRSR